MSTMRIALLLMGLCLSMFLVALDFVRPTRSLLITRIY
jgi:hypothetical protein